MAKARKGDGGPEKGAPEKKRDGGASGLVLLTSSFALVLTGMMFATGTAQRTAIPRLREMAAHLPFVKQPAADSIAVTSDSSAVNGRSPVATSPSWNTLSDSLAMLEDRLSIALAEIETSSSRIDESPEGAAESLAETDPGAARDLARLVKVLDAMKPAEAARILNAVDHDLAVEAIRKLKERQAGKVLALMEPTKAVAVGAALGRGAGGSL